MKERISKTLFAMRAIHKMTSKEMASRLGISQAQYSKIETGEKEVSLQKLKKIAGIFNIELPTLLQLILRSNNETSHTQTENAASEKLPDIPAQTLEQIFQPSFVNIYRQYFCATKKD